MSTIYPILQKLKDHPSRLDKERILKEEDSPLLRRVFQLTYNTMTQFHIKAIPTYYPHAENTLEEVLGALKTLSSRELTGKAAQMHLANMLSSLDSEDAKVLEMIIGRHLDCGVSASTLNKVYGKGFIPEFKVMLASKQDEKTLAKVKFPAMAQKKADAMRINAFCIDGEVSFFSRNGKPVDAGSPQLVADVLQVYENYGQNCCIDGELICYRDGQPLPRKESNGLANKAIKGTISDEERDLFRIEAWDLIPYDSFVSGKDDERYDARFYRLDEIIAENMLKSIFMIESTQVKSVEEAAAISQGYIDAGYEGIILKNIAAPWVNKRSKDLVKFKALYDGDFIIVDWEEGTGINEGRLGALVIESACGRIRTNVGTGFSFEDRDTITRDVIGKIVEVQYNEIISAENRDTYKLYLPVFVEIREDKDEANSLEELEGLKDG